MDYQLHHRLVTWLEVAAENLRLSLKEELLVEEKSGAADLVTEMDRATEAYLVENIRRYYPDHQILGEEGLGDQVTSTQGTVWLIDPIDGTLNFVKMQRDFAIMVGLFQDGQAKAGYIYDVMQGDLYYALEGEGLYLNHQPYSIEPLDTLSDALMCANTKGVLADNFNQQALIEASLGVRAYGSAAIETLAVLRGEVGLYVSPSLQPWDFGAGLAICDLIGYPVTQLDGRPLNILERSSVVFAHPKIHSQALTLLSQD